MKSCRIYGSLGACLLWALTAVSPALAGPYTLGGIVSPAVSPYVPSVDEVGGKEYSNHLDMEGYSGNAPDPEQNIAWDGVGGTRDAFDYSGSRTTILGDIEDREVDALANQNDALFTAVTENQVALLFSTEGDPNVYVEYIGGEGSIWATPAQINDEGVYDVDGLEVWGNDAEEFDDANRYSLEGDTVIDPTNQQRVSVFSYNLGTNISDVVFYADDIAEALGNTYLTDILDVDAIMTYGDAIMFSLNPIDGLYDGGEIWIWDGLTSGGATFLNHGGHLWDTAFDVQGTFGTFSENVNALEAVGVIPEPTTMLLFGVGLVGLAAVRRKKLN